MPLAAMILALACLLSLSPHRTNAAAGQPPYQRQRLTTHLVIEKTYNIMYNSRYWFGNSTTPVSGVDSSWQERQI